MKLKVADIQTQVITILSQAAKGRGKKPQYVTAYQIFRRLPVAIRNQLIQERGKPGKGGGNEFAAASLVAKACQTVPNIIIRYLDTDGLIFETGKTRTARAGYKVCAIYRLTALIDT